MTSYIYKNLLIIERGSTHSIYIKNMNITFEDETTPFIYKNNLDKIIFCFNHLLQVSNDIKILEPSYNVELLKYEYSNNALIGIIKVSSDRNNLKIYHADFKDNIGLKNSFIIFREYLVRNIYSLNLSDNIVNESNFLLHWDFGILTFEQKNILKTIGLYTNFGPYKFTAENIKCII